MVNLDLINSNTSFSVKMKSVIIFYFLGALIFAQDYQVRYSNIPIGQGIIQADSIRLINSVGGILSQDIVSDSFIVGSGFLKGAQNAFAEPPVISDFSIPSLINSQDDNSIISAVITDLNGIATATLEIQTGGSSQPLSLSMLLSSGSNYRLTIPDSLISINNFRARVIGVDNMGLSTSSEYKTAAIKFSDSELSMSSRFSYYPNGISPGVWKLISWPGDPANKTLAESDLDDGHAFYTLNMFTKKYVIADSIELGNSYWFRHEYDSDTLMFSEDTSTAIPLENYIIDLEEGWNMVGSPFAFPVRFEIDSTVESPWYYGSLSLVKGWSQEESFLKPWKGYAIYASEESDITLLPFSNSIASSNRFADDSWVIGLKIESKNFIHNVVKLGRRNNAQEGRDRYDVPAPPDIENNISVLMDLSGTSSFRYSKDIRGMDEFNGVWNIRIETNGEKEPIEITGQFQGQRPEGLVLAVVDIEKRIIIDNFIDQRSKITKADDRIYDLKLVAGDQDYVLEKTQEIINNIPIEYSLSQNYPNPFNPITKLDFSLPKRSQVTFVIFNILGQEVTTLINKELDYGHHKVKWNGTDFHGKQVSSGVYFAKMVTSDFTKSKKMLLLK